MRARRCPAIAPTTPERYAVGFEHRTLLDVDLVVADQVRRLPARVSQCVWIAAECAQGVGQGHAARVAPLQIARFETAGDDAAAQVTGAVADAFLIGERKHLDGVGQRPPLIAQSLETPDRHEHPEHAVVAARAADRVEVGADQQCPAIGIAETADDVADRVAPDKHARRFHPFAHGLAGLPELGCREEPRQTAFILAEGGEFVAAPKHGRCVGHGITHRCAVCPRRRR